MPHRPFRTIFVSLLPVLLVATAVMAEAQAAGRYQKHGAYRSGGQHLGSQHQAKPSYGRHYSAPWRPMYYSQRKYYQWRSPLSHVGNLSRSDLRSYGNPYSYGFGPVLPGPVIYPTYIAHPQAAPPQQPAPQPQVVIVQAPPQQAAPPPPPPPAAPVYAPPAPPPEPVSNDPGEVSLTVHPASTEIYLNDRFVGTGVGLAGDDDGLVMKPGVYVLQASHPDHKAQRLVFGVTPGETTRIVVDLTDERPGHRARVETGSGSDFILNR